MDPGRWLKLRPLLDRALELDDAARGALLDDVGTSDPGMRADLERLLRGAGRELAVDRPAAVIAAPLLAGGATAGGRDWDSEQVGRRIGPYVLERLLGAGGMGTVYAGRRDDGRFEQTVAVKLVLVAHPGLHERFAREQQILAAQRHPHIAQLFDAGETDDGLPYLIMEHVAGVPITETVAARADDLPALLALLEQVAHALAHAHRNLVVHRDIKPSNILVTRLGGVKLLDFGIAKLLGAAEAPGDALTADRLGPMTPEYAAPEQFRGRAIGVGTDVYQFGVLMFRLLAGRLPYDADPRDPLAFARAVVEDPPLTLLRARRLAVEAGRSVPAPSAAVERALRGDLQAIVGRCLAKDIGQRYPSMDAVLADLEAHRESRPVAARGAGRTYAARRFVARHRVPVALGAFVALALAVGSAYALQLARTAREQAALAQRQAARAEASLAFLEGMFGSADAGRNRADRLTAATLLARANTQLEATAGDDVLLRGRLHALLGRIHAAMSDWPRAFVHLRDAIAAYDATGGVDPLQLASTLERGAWAAQRTSRNALAWQWLVRFEALRPRLGSAADALEIEALLTRATLLRDRRDFAGALAQAEKALAISERLDGGTDSVRTANVLTRMVVMQGWLRRREEAERTLERARAIHVAAHGEDHVDVIGIDVTRAVQLAGRGRVDDAIAALIEIEPRLRDVAGPRSTAYANLLLETGKLESRRGEHDVARAHIDAAADIFAETSGPGSMPHALMLWTAAGIESARGRHEEARALQARVATMLEAIVDADSPVLGELWTDVAATELARGRVRECRAALERALAILGADASPALPRALRLRGDVDESGERTAWHRKALAAAERIFAADAPELDAYRRLP